MPATQKKPIPATSGPGGIRALGFHPDLVDFSISHSAPSGATGFCRRLFYLDALGLGELHRLREEKIHDSVLRALGAQVLAKKNAEETPLDSVPEGHAGDWIASKSLVPSVIASVRVWTLDGSAEKIKAIFEKDSDAGIYAHHGDLFVARITPKTLSLLAECFEVRLIYTNRPPWSRQYWG